MNDADKSIGDSIILVHDEGELFIERADLESAHDNTSINFDELNSDNWKSSEARRCYGGQAIPTITISQSTIWVYHKADKGCRVHGTRLVGSGGKYTFPIPGKYQIEPGEYSHDVRGTIAPYRGRCIYSGIRYK